MAKPTTPKVPVERVLPHRWVPTTDGTKRKLCRYCGVLKGELRECERPKGLMTTVTRHGVEIYNIWKRAQGVSKVVAGLKRQTSFTYGDRVVHKKRGPGIFECYADARASCLVRFDDNPGESERVTARLVRPHTDP